MESDFAKGFDNTTATISETNFQKFYYPAFAYYESCSMAKIRKVRVKIARGCAINSHRMGISLLQALNFCPVSDTYSWFDGLLVLIIKDFLRYSELCL